MKKQQCALDSQQTVGHVNSKKRKTEVSSKIMKQYWGARDSGKLLLKGLCILFVSITFLGLSITGTARAKDTATDDEWQFLAGLYGWGAFINGETASDSDLKINLDDILENLKFTFMADVGVRKNKWLFDTDIIYLDLEDDKDSTVPENGVAIGLHTDVELKAWIITPKIGYEIVNSEMVRLSVFGGARYLYLDAKIEETINTPARPLYGQIDESGSVWDGIVGVRGLYSLSERWYLPFYLDIGTGDSDFTWQVNAGVGYKFDVCDVLLTYRYLDWNFDDNAALDDLNVNGPLLGVKFAF